MTIQGFCIALCFFAILEGLGPSLFPNKWRNFMSRMTSESAADLQKFGGILVAMGILGLILIF